MSLRMYHYLNNQKKFKYNKSFHLFQINTNGYDGKNIPEEKEESRMKMPMIQTIKHILDVLHQCNQSKFKIKKSLVNLILCIFLLHHVQKLKT